MKPMMFNEDMVKAILEGRKTVTRRPVKPRYREGECGFMVIFKVPSNEYVRVEILDEWEDETRYLRDPYSPGEIVYVPEAWKMLDMWNTPDLSRVCARVQFRDGDGMRFPFYDKERAEKWRKYLDKPKNKWQSPYFMPKEAARTFLRVTGVRVERLQEPFFAVGDKPIRTLKKEGMPLFEECKTCIDCYGRPACISEDDGDVSECGLLDEARGDFSLLWDRTIKENDRELYGWPANPWVWVIEFERISREEAKRYGT